MRCFRPTRWNRIWLGFFEYRIVSYPTPLVSNRTLSTQLRGATGRGESTQTNPSASSGTAARSGVARHTAVCVVAAVIIRDADGRRSVATAGALALTLTYSKP